MDDQILEGILRVAENAVHNEHGWDKPPGMLYLMHDTTQTTAVLKTMNLRFTEHPADVMRKLANRYLVDRTGRALALKQMPGFFGLVLAFESWALAPHMDDPAAVADAMAAGGRREIYAHPDRVEVRSFLAATVEGRLVELHRRRDTDQVRVVWDSPDDPMVGSFQRQLRRLVEAFRGRG